MASNAATHLIGDTEPNSLRQAQALKDLGL